MILRRALAVGLLATLAFTASGADEPPPLSLDQALEEASRRRPERLLGDTRGLPYLLVAPPIHEFMAPRAAARMEAMARYFDVILVDLDEAALSERMSTAYVAWDRRRVRLPEATETLHAHHVYQDLLARRNAARKNQRIARSVLAIALGRPDRLPAELVEPALPAVDLPLASEVPSQQSPTRSAGRDGARRAHSIATATLDLEWLVRSEQPRVRARNVLAEQLLDEARANHDARQPADLGNAMAAIVEGQRDARSVAFAIALTRERVMSLRIGSSAVPLSR